MEEKAFGNDSAYKSRDDPSGRHLPVALAPVKGFMKHHTMEFTNQLSTAHEPSQIVAELTKEKGDHYDIGFLFVSVLNNAATTAIIEQIKQQLSVDYLLGCTCAGIIGTNAEIERLPASTLILGKLPGVKVLPFSLNQTQLEGFKHVDDWYQFFNVFPHENPKFLILPDPFLFDLHELLNGLNQIYPGCPVIGGLASGALQPRENLLFINNEAHEEGIVGVALVGNFNVKTIVSQGCRPIGDTYIVTRAENNIIYTLAGRPFIKVLEEVLQKATTRDRLLAQEAIFVGIAMNEYTHNFRRGDFLIRTVMALDQNTGAGVITDYIKAGQTIQFQVRDAETATEDLNELLRLHCTKEENKRPKGALVFSCNGRGENLFRMKNHDIAIIQKCIGPVPAAGFFCAGEIGPVGGSNFLHGFTNSIALFYPEEDKLTAKQ